MAKAKKAWNKPWDTKGNYGTFEGPFGTPAEWANIFEQVWSQTACIEILKEETPFDVLGVSITSTWEEIKAAFRALVKVIHPDRGATGNEERCKKVLAAYSILKERFEK
jgi:DnaJ-class molecular chaperone